MRHFALYTLTDEAEQDDHCAGIYHKSLLYLVSNAFEDEMRIPLFRGGRPLLGMAKFVRRDPDLQALFHDGADWVEAPNQFGERSPQASRASRHGAFDDDPATLRSTLRRILGGTPSQARLSFPRSASGLQDDRRSRLGL